MKNSISGLRWRQTPTLRIEHSPSTIGPHSTRTVTHSTALKSSTGVRPHRREGLGEVARELVGRAEVEHALGALHVVEAEAGDAGIEVGERVLPAGVPLTCMQSATGAFMMESFHRQRRDLRRSLNASQVGGSRELAGLGA
ncbi:MAG: hypothetical protein H6713_36440 [Myxococcales bacterium]|nr:hypothetical protein [Myxococcales bacterium]